MLADGWLSGCLLCSAAGLMINHLKPPLPALCCSNSWYHFRDVPLQQRNGKHSSKKDGFSGASLPSTGQSESVGRRQLQIASYQSLEHWEQTLSQLPDDRQKHSTQNQAVAAKSKIIRRSENKLPNTPNIPRITSLLNLSIHGWISFSNGLKVERCCTVQQNLKQERTWG